MHRIALALTLLLAGCPSGEMPDGDTTPWIYEDDPTTGAPPLTEAEVADSIEEALATVLALDPVPALETFDSILAEGTAGCPYVVNTTDSGADVTFWQDACSTEAGAAFEGFGYRYTYDDYATQGGLVLDGVSLFLSGELISADGAVLSGSGTVASVTGGTDFYELYQRQLRGSFLVDGRALDVAGLPWLDGSLAPDFDVSVVYVPEVTPANPSGLDARQISLNGGLSGLSLGTVAFDGVVLTERTAGATCDLEPHGDISVRGPDGAWIDVLFDAPEEPSEPMSDPSLCDGCGTAWYRGEPLDDVCVDFTGLFAWEGRPW